MRVFGRFRAVLELTRAYGSAAVGLAFLALLIGMLIVSSTPIEVDVNVVLEPPGDEQHWLQLKAEYSRWFDQQDGIRVGRCSLVDRSSLGGHAEFSCTVTAPNADAYFDAFQLLKQELTSSGLEMVGWQMSTRPASREIPWWSITLAAAIHLVLVAFMIRHLDLVRDLKAGARALRSRPWLPLAPLGVWFVVANVSYGVMSLIFGDSMPLPLATEPIDEGELKSVYRAGMAMMLSPWHIMSAIVLAPLLEETVFRQVAYQRFAERRVRIHSIVNAWFFMIAHVAISGIGQVLGAVGNPVQSSVVVIPVWFFVGLLLFWVRHTYNSLSLCIGLHAFYNCVFLVAVYLFLIT